MICTHSYINNIYDLHNILDEVKPFKCGEIEFKILKKNKCNVIFHHLSTQKNRQIEYYKGFLGQKMALICHIWRKKI
jgi:hypothetical protein